MLLTTEYNKKGFVEIHFDQEGLDLLIGRLESLRQRGKQDHEHLMTPSWAGNELTEEKQGSDNELINHLCLIYWADALRFLTQGLQVPVSVTDAVRDELNQMSLDEVFQKIDEIEEQEARRSQSR